MSPTNIKICNVTFNKTSNETNIVGRFAVKNVKHMREKTCVLKVYKGIVMFCQSVPILSNGLSLLLFWLARVIDLSNKCNQNLYYSWIINRSGLLLEDEQICALSLDAALPLFENKKV